MRMSIYEIPIHRGSKHGHRWMRLQQLPPAQPIHIQPYKLKYKDTQIHTQIYIYIRRALLTKTSPFFSSLSSPVGLVADASGDSRTGSASLMAGPGVTARAVGYGVTVTHILPQQHGQRRATTLGQVDEQQGREVHRGARESGCCLRPRRAVRQRLDGHSSRREYRHEGDIFPILLATICLATWFDIGTAEDLVI